MKLSLLQQSYLNRRSNSFRGPLDSSSADSPIKSPSAFFWLLLHALCCLVSLVLGFRFSRLVFFFLFSTYSSTSPIKLYSAPFRHFTTSSTTPAHVTNLPFSPPLLLNQTVSSRVVVGRHGIRIRPWPHPNLNDVVKAHQIIERVQREQRLQFGVKTPKKLIVVTPTYVRTFQTLHLTGLMHSLMLVPYDVVWIVVEAGGTTNETASILAKSGVNTVHFGFEEKMPNSWEERHRLEAKMRFHALRVVRKQRMEGVVVFGDDSNMHNMEFFDEIQNVKWIGAVSVGILVHSGGDAAGGDELSSEAVEKGKIEEGSMPVQGPACNGSNMLVGWHTFNSLPYKLKSAVYIDDSAMVLPRKMEWAGFVLNARLVWKEGGEGRPEWVRDLDSVGEEIESPLDLVNDHSVVEPLGSCGRQVLLWWLRVEARADSKFPPGWIIDPRLEVTVPSKRTPWPDAPPELPSNEKSTLTTQEHTIKQSSKTRRSRRSRSKRKHEAKLGDPQASTHHSEQN